MMLGHGKWDIYINPNANFDKDDPDYIIDWSMAKIICCNTLDENYELTELKASTGDFLFYMIMNGGKFNSEYDIYINGLGRADKYATGADPKSSIRSILSDLKKHLKHFPIENKSNWGYSFTGSWKQEDTFLDELSAMSLLNAEKNSTFREQVRHLSTNIYLTTKQETENKNSFPFSEKLCGISHIVLMNYAGSSFISSEAIAKAYSSTDKHSKWFFHELINGKIEATIVLTNPHSDAAKDAVLSKINPRSLQIPKEEIIQHNINTLLDFKKKHPNSNIHLYLTDIALPYGIMLGENDSDRSVNFMKVDLYSPLGGSLTSGFDDDRPSFYLLQEERSTQAIYSNFLGVINRVIVSSRTKKYDFDHRQMDWLLKTPIIHRGRLFEEVPEHSVRGYIQCMNRRYPIEIDLLFLKDHTILVGRDAVLVNKQNGEKIRLSNLYPEELRSLKTKNYMTLEGKNPSFQIEELMTLPELLNMVSGKSGLLIEVKTSDTNASKNAKIAKQVVNALRYYTGQYAIHSANPDILRSIRKLDATVLLGQISWSYNGVDVSDETKMMHQEFKFLDIFVPDFISYKNEEISDNLLIKRDSRTMHLPLLAWTIHNKEGEERAKKYCDNYIIEGSSSYIKPY